MATLLFVLSAPAAAQDTASVATPDRWKISAEMSYTDQSGNRVLRLLTGGLRVSHLEKEDFRLDGSLQSRYGQSEGEVVARNHYAALTFDLHPQRPWSPFFFVDAERDAFKRLDLRFKGGAGAKHTLRRSGSGEEQISASLAVLFAYEDIRTSPQDPFPDDGGLARWSLRVRGSRELGSSVTLQHVTFYQPAWDQVADYLLRSETEAKVLLTERLALSVAYQINRTAIPPEGVQPDDRLFKTGLIIDF